MDAININITQVMGTVLGLLVIVGGVAVNIRKFGADIPLSNIALFVLLGGFIALSIFLLSRD